METTTQDQATTTARTRLTRDEAIAAIRKALKARSLRAWTVKGGRGTAWGWITIDTTPARKALGHDYEREDRHQLAALLCLPAAPYGSPAWEHPGDVSIPSGGDYYREYVDRAEGRPPSVIGKPYWD